MVANASIRSAGAAHAARRCLLMASALLLASVLLLAQAPVAQAEPAWSPPQNLSPGSGFFPYNENPEMAVDADGNTHVVWVGYGGPARILYATNAGGAWSEPLVISTNAIYNWDPHIAVDAEGNPHAVWSGYDESYDYYSIWYSANPGTGWEDPVLISTSPCAGDQYDPRIAVSPDGIPHAVWYGYDESDDYYRIWYATNPGTGWQAPTLLSTSPCAYSQYEPQIELDSGGSPHVVWYGYDDSYNNYNVWYSTNPGTGWQAPTLISTSPCAYWQYEPQIKLDSGDSPHVVWYGYDSSYNRYHVWYATDPGTGWGAPVPVSTAAIYQYEPQLALDSGDNPHVVWYGYSQDWTGSSIYYSTNPGTGWEAPAVVSTSPCAYYQYEPQIALDSGDSPHVVWHGYDSSYDDYHVWYATNPGTGWQAPTLLSTNSIYSYYPRIAVDPDGNPHAVWSGYSQDWTRLSIYYSTDPGAGWSSPLEVSAQTDYEGSVLNEDPQIAVDTGGNLHAVWAGHDGAGWQIFYSTDTGTGWGAPHILSTTSDDNYLPQIAVGAEGTVHVVWYGYGYSGDTYSSNIYYSTNPGTGWEGPTLLSTSPCDYYQYRPQIELDSGGSPHVVWYGYDDSYDSYFIWYATNPGTGWQAPTLLSTSPCADYQYRPQIELDSGDSPHVVWYGFDGSYYRIWYATDPGTGWGAPVVVSTAPCAYGQYEPQIALDSEDDPHVVWYGYDGSYNNYNVWYSTNPGTGWQAPTLISTSPCAYSQYRPQIELDSGDSPHVVWYGYDDSWVYRIWYSTNPGTGWQAPTLISTSPCAYSQDRPQIELDSGDDPHVVWYGYDESDEFYRIWYATDPGTGWQAPTLLSTSPCAYGQYRPQIALDPGDNPHVVWGGQEEGTGIDRIWYSGSAEYTVTARVEGGGGSVSPATQQVARGGTATVEITPDPGYRTASITDNGAAQPVSEPYVISNVRQDHDVAVTFTRTMADWYIAEGATAGGMETWILVQNPNGSPVTVDLTLMTENGLLNPPELQNVPVPANSRTSFNLGSVIDSYHVSTMVTAEGGSVVCERAMYGGGRTWGTASIGATSPSDTWYLAEGATDGGMETWILVQNPGESPVKVDVTFMTGNGEVAGPQGYIVDAGYRTTFSANDYVTGYHVSTMVTAEGGGIVCERSMYGGDRTWGTASIGATSPSDTWYLAEGATEGGIETWVLVQNPGATPVSVDLTLMTDSGILSPPELKGVALGANSRRSFNLGDYAATYHVSAMVTASGGGIVCERAMYGGDRTWGTASIGATSPSDTWYLAEGATEGGFETWVLVQNPGAAPVTVDVTYMTGTGAVPGPQGFSIPAHTRVSFNAADHVTDYNVSTMVTASGGGIVCERAMYGNSRTWAHVSVGHAP